MRVPVIRILGDTPFWGRLVAQIVAGQRVEAVIDGERVKLDEEMKAIIGRVQNQLLPLPWIVSIESDRLLGGENVPLLVDQAGNAWAWIERRKDGSICVVWVQPGERDIEYKYHTYLVLN